MYRSLSPARSVSQKRLAARAYLPPRSPCHLPPRPAASAAVFAPYRALCSGIFALPGDRAAAFAPYRTAPSRRFRLTGKPRGSVFALSDGRACARTDHDLILPYPPAFCNETQRAAASFVPDSCTARALHSVWHKGAFLYTCFLPLRKPLSFPPYPPVGFLLMGKNGARARARAPFSTRFMLLSCRRGQDFRSKDPS